MTPKKAEEIFLSELEDQKALLWCYQCQEEIYFINPIVSRTIHHPRPGGTTYFVSGNCPKCYRFTWESFRFRRSKSRKEN